MYIDIYISMVMVIYLYYIALINWRCLNFCTRFAHTIMKNSHKQSDNIYFLYPSGNNVYLYKITFVSLNLLD